MLWPVSRFTTPLRQEDNREQPEDIARDTMLTAWRKLHLFSTEKGGVFAWINAFRLASSDDSGRSQPIWHRYYAESSNSVDQSETRPGERCEIEGVLGRLPPEQLQIIKLSFINGLTQTEIAEMLSVSLDTVKSRMRLVFEKLRFDMERKI